MEGIDRRFRVSGPSRRQVRLLPHVLSEVGQTNTVIPPVAEAFSPGVEKSFLSAKVPVDQSVCTKC